MKPDVTMRQYNIESGGFDEDPELAVQVETDASIDVYDKEPTVSLVRAEGGRIEMSVEEAREVASVIEQLCGRGSGLHLYEHEFPEKWKERLEGRLHKPNWIGVDSGVFEMMERKNLVNYADDGRVLFAGYPLVVHGLVQRTES